MRVEPTTSFLLTLQIRCAVKGRRNGVLLFWDYLNRYGRDLAKGSASSTTAMMSEVIVSAPEDPLQI